MSSLDPRKLHIHFAEGVTPQGPLTPRRYTLTHSDSTGELFLTIAPEVDRKQISGWYTRLMRDEVVAEWQESADGPSLHLFCHVSGGLVFGGAGMRYGIFQRELTLVLQALRFGDRALFEAQPELDLAPIWVHFQSTNACYRRTERWGTPIDYRARSLPPGDLGGEPRV
jgi:Staygreen protein